MTHVSISLLIALSLILPAGTASAASLSLTERVAQRRALRIDQTTTISPARPARESSRTRRTERLTTAPAAKKALLIEAINKERAKHSQRPLRYNAKLEKSAQAHAEDMKLRKYFAHETPEGKRSSARMQEAGYGIIKPQNCNCRYSVSMAENIAQGQTTITEVVEDWMNSPPHREAMLSGSYKEIGIGITDNIWVLNFGGIEMTTKNN